MFAFEQANLQPDIVCVGKGLTGGSVGLAATIATQSVYQPFHTDSWDHALMHGPTYMGNPIACAAANASLDLFEQEPRLEQVQMLEMWLSGCLEPLKAHPRVVDVRCKGAVGVVQLEDDVPLQSAIEFFVDRGCWLRPLQGCYLRRSQLYNGTAPDRNALCHNQGIRRYAMKKGGRVVLPPSGLPCQIQFGQLRVPTRCLFDAGHHSEPN